MCNFVKPKNLKNKNIIHLCINSLIGLLFIFPVFSAQNIDLNERDSELSCNSQSITCISNINDNSEKFLPVNKSPEYFHLISFSKKFKYTSKYKFSLNHSPPDFKEFIGTETSSNNFYLESTYVNLSYLKDLKITKMLC